MLNYIKLISLSMILLISAGCSSDNDDWEKSAPTAIPSSHSMGYKGNVRHVEVYNEEMDMMEMKADFDAAGHCIYWDATGVPEENVTSSQTKSMGSGWLSSPARYSYTYNDKGQLVSVVCAQLGGEVEHFTITYGSHPLWLPLPFPVGALSPFMVKGIASITSEHYSLSCDGQQATAEHKILSWMALTEKTEFVFENQKVSEQISRLYSKGREGEETKIQRTRTFYTYAADVLHRLLEVTVDEEGYQEKNESVYHPSVPYQLLKRCFYTGMESAPLYETIYTYDAEGRIVEVYDASGEGFFEMPYVQKYLSFDQFGNWISSSRYFSEEEVYTLTQHIEYW